MDVISDIVEVRNVLSDGKTGQGFASSAVSAICGDGANDLNAVSAVEVQNRSTTDAIDSDTINKVGVSELLTGTDVARKEAKVVRSDGRETKPADLSADVNERAHWEKCYGALWKLKIDFEKKNYR